MADNVNLTAGDGSVIAASEKIGGVDYPRIILGWGPAGTVNKTDIASGKALPVQLRTAGGTATPLPALGTAGTASADVITIQGIASGTVVPVSGTVTANAGTNLNTSALATVAKQPALGTAGSASTDVITIQGIASGTVVPVSNVALGTSALDQGSGTGGSHTLRTIIDSSQVPTIGQTTMSGSIPVVFASNQSAVPSSQSGTWTVQPGNTANTTAWKVDSSAVTQPVSNSLLTNLGVGEYETVAASQTDQVMGATGATGDYLSAVLIVPATAAAGAVSIKDGSTSISIFAGGGTTALPTLAPIRVDLGMISVSGAWKVTTGTNVSAIGIGNFT